MRKFVNLFILVALLVGMAGAPTSGPVTAHSPAAERSSQAQLAPGGTIQGRVKPAQAGLIIRAIDGAGQMQATTWTDEQGTYALERLAPGLYRLEVLTREDAPLSLKDSRMVQVQGVNTIAQAPTLELAVETPVSSQHVTAPTAATIQGTVTGAGYGALPYVYITAYEEGKNYWSYSATADTNGAYTLTVATGNYKLKFDRHDQFAPEWYNNQPDLESATVLTVVDGATLTGIDAELAIGGTISGTVTDESINPMEDGSIYAIDSDGNYVSYAYVLSDGTYQLKGLPTGNFRVQFNPPYLGYPDYIREYYDDQPNLQNADLVPVILGNNTPNINAELAPGGAITGTLTAVDDGAPLEGRVYLYGSRTDGQDSLITSTPANSGKYEFHGVAPGVYYLRARSDYDLPYLDEYYENQAELAQATPITVVVGATEQINFALERGATIHGQVRDGTSQDSTLPIADAQVTLYDAGHDWADSTSTDAQGYYTFTALTSGTYYLGYAANRPQNYIPEYYNEKASLAEADPLQITAPQVLQANAELVEGGLLSGRVTAADGGTPLENVHVDIYILDECNDYSPVDTLLTDASGHYTVTSLITGTYYVYFETFYSSGLASLYLGQPYRTAAQINSPAGGGGGGRPKEIGDPIQIAPGHPVSDIDAALQRGGQIAGKVTAEDSGLPLSDLKITIYTPEIDYLGYLPVEASGVYTTPALSAGSYILYFEPYYDGSATAYIPEYYNNQLFANQAITIPVSLGATTTGIDISLARGAQVSGKVIADGTGHPLSDVEIGLSAVDNGIYRYAYTDENGDFVTPGAPNGAYKLAFFTSNWDDGVREYVDEYYNGQASWDEATPIQLTTATLYPGYNAGLALGGEISGTVIAESDGAPLENVHVYAYATAQRYIGYSSTDQAGRYIMYGLPPGPVKVKFFGPDVTQQCQVIHYANEYYNDKADFETADPVTVTPPGTTPNINASLVIEKIVGLIELFLPIVLRP